MRQDKQTQWRKFSLALLGPLSAVATPTVLAQAVESTLNPVVISVTRSERSSADVPASVDVVDRAAIADQLQINMSEFLSRVPGIVAQNRQNYAQDLQISSRGFGARSTFGVRGLRLYVDGIPATMPDGQSQISHIDLGSAARVEVLRGPFSALYGNSSGGVISVFTQDGGPKTVAEGGLAFGSDSTSRLGLKISGQEGRLNYVVSTSFFQTDGYRDHSAAERQNLNAKLKIAVSDDTRVTLIANTVRMPDLQDPLGLDRASFDANPRQAAAVATQFNTRKSVDQTQLGAVLDHRLSANQALQWSVYTGTRGVTQFQAIPVGTQAPATHPGGVIDLDRRFTGTDLRWTGKGTLMGLPASLTAGLTYDQLTEERRGYQNFIGPTLGVQGALRRDEQNKVRSVDQYVQGEWSFAERWTASAGVRHSKVSFDSADRFLSNGNGSGAADYSATTPVLGLVFHASDALNLYTTWGRGFETPTLNELAYRPSGAQGLNFALNPAKSSQWEIGAKARLSPNWQTNVAYFQARTRDEIVVQTNTGGRTVFQNAGRTERNGFEATLAGQLGSGFSTYLALTQLNATYRDGFLTCVAAPCAAPNVAIAAGNRIPGIPKTSVYAELAWKQLAWGFETALEVRRLSKVFVNDANSDAAAGYTVANLRLAWQQKVGQWTFREFARVDNLSDKAYAGSVIVNDGNGRFFEPAPGRTWLLGVNAAYTF
jgi:iron complex outermembrane recepter protein